MPLGVIAPEVTALRRAERLLKGAKDVPSLPAATLRVLAMLRDPDTSAARIAQVVTTDPGLTARLLCLANSAYYGYARRIATVTEAAVLLGSDALRSVVLTASARATLSQPLRGYGCSQEGLWRHSVWTATAARLLEARVRPALAEQAFVAGLLHDVGKIVIAANHGEQFVSICRKVEREGKSFAEAEAEVLGCSHAEIGGVLAQQWRLPESLAEAVTYHHTPAAAEVDVALAAAVQVADALVLSLGVGAVPEVRAREISESALPLARVPAAVLLSVREEVPQSAAELERLVEE